MADPIRFPLDNISMATLRIYTAVVEAEGFSAAARQLNVSVSTVSKAVSTLERAMNLALLFRTTRNVVVTEPGRLFYQRCIAVLAEIDAATQKGADGLSGRLRVSVPPSVASAIVGPNIGGFLQRHPRLTVDFFVTSALPDIIRNRIDVAIVLRPWPEVKMAHRLIARLKRVLCASPTYVDRFGLPQKPADLRHHTCLLSLISGSVEPWLLHDRGVAITLQPNAAMCSDNGDLLKEACLDSFGIANLYEFHARDALRSGRLVEVMPDIRQDPIGLYAVLPHKEMVKSPASAFMDYMAGLMVENQPLDAGAVQ